MPSVRSTGVLMSDYDKIPGPDVGLTPLGQRYASPVPTGSSAPWAPPNPRDRSDDPPSPPRRRARPWRVIAIAGGIVIVLVGGLFLVAQMTKPTFKARVVSIVPQEPHTGIQPDGSQAFDFGYTYTLTYSITNLTKDQTVQPTCIEYLGTSSSRFVSDFYGIQVPRPIPPGKTVEFTVDMSPPSFGGSPVTSAANAPSQTGGVDCKD
jgi:hypothetical protein